MSDEASQPPMTLLLGRVSRNVAWNVVGTGMALVVGLVGFAVLLQTLGTARLGIFTLAIGLIGFTGLLDLGLGRGLTRKVAHDLGHGRPPEQVAAFVVHVLRILGAIGLVAGLVLWLSTPLLVLHAFKLSGPLAEETTFGLRAIALSLPVALVATGAMGALEGLQQFRRLGIQRAWLSVLQFGLPALVSLLLPHVGWVIAALALSRLAAFVVWLRTLNAVLPLPNTASRDGNDVREVVRFGGWLSVSSVVGPVMVFGDRFYLASIFPPAAIAYHTVPFDSLFRATSLPATAMGAVFPAFAEVNSQPERSAQLTVYCGQALIACMLPAIAFASVFAPQLLAEWLGDDFATNATEIARWILVGVMINSAAHVPYALLQASGRADLTAKQHLIQLPFFIGVLVAAVSAWGVLGAAITWAARVALDAAMLFAAVTRHLPLHRRAMGQLGGMVALSALLVSVPLFGTVQAINAGTLGVSLLVSLILFGKLLPGVLGKP
jgi:O-antigen/teichoic acid export membrane protein